MGIRKPNREVESTGEGSHRRIRVLVVDDQPSFREFVDRGLSGDPAIEVVGRAANACIARDKILRLDPDVLALDSHMPLMNGVEFLRKLMRRYPLPVVLISSGESGSHRAGVEALAAGAVDFVRRPRSDEVERFKMIEELREKVKLAAGINREKWSRLRFERKAIVLRHKSSVPPVIKSVQKIRDPRVPSRQANGRNLPLSSRIELIAIGASTGGTVALRQLLGGLNRQIPGMIVAQHMPAGFTSFFAKNLNDDFPFEISEARDVDNIEPGRVLIAPGDFHTEVKKEGRIYKIRLSKSEPVGGNRPRRWEPFSRKRISMDWLESLSDGSTPAMIEN